MFYNLEIGRLYKTLDELALFPTKDCAVLAVHSLKRMTIQNTSVDIWSNWLTETCKKNIIVTCIDKNDCFLLLMFCTTTLNTIGKFNISKFFYKIGWIVFYNHSPALLFKL